MDKYELLKRFHHDCLLQVYIYDCMYVYPNIIKAEEYFPNTKTIVENYNKISTPGQVPKHWLGFSYTCSEDYD